MSREAAWRSWRDASRSRLPGRGQEIHRRGRVLLEQRLDVLAIDHHRLQILGHQGRGGAGTGVDERQLAEEIARPRPLQHDPLAGVVLEEDLHLPFPDDVERVARIAVAEEHLARGRADRLHLGRQRRPLVGVEQLEQRNLRQDFGIGAHGWLRGEAAPRNIARDRASQADRVGYLERRARLATQKA